LPHRRPVRPSSEQQDRRVSFTSDCEQRTEIGVCRDKDAIFTLGQYKYRFVFGSLQPVVAHVCRIMALLLQTLRDQW